MLSERKLFTAKILASVAATCIALGCGSNYVYSAWGPQFAEHLKLSSTESNLIGASGNLGMYLTGIPVGMLVDRKGPRVSAFIGAFLLGLGYFPLHLAYNSASGSVVMLCIYSFFTGMGGSFAFAAAVKVSALNWPNHRGTATAFPLAAFGLSAFFFSVFAHQVFPGSPGDFLLLLACGTFGLVFFSVFFLQVWQTSSYSSLPTNEGRSRTSSVHIHRTKSRDSRYEPVLGAEAPAIITAEEASDTSSLLSHTSDVGRDGSLVEEHHINKEHHHVDVSGVKLLSLLSFWQCFTLMGVMTGVGLMTINNIGNDTNALWRHYDDSVSEDRIMQHQAMHVSIISIGSFTGRLLSGVGSDFLVKKFHASRYWCMVIAASIFSVAQLCAMNIENPNHLILVSTSTGLAYGFLFGVSPSLIAELFGIRGLSQNWGTMTLSPVISGNIFNIVYGRVFDHHSTILPDGDRECLDGLACYRPAYYMTFISCIASLAIALWAIHHERARKIKMGKARAIEHDA